MVSPDDIIALIIQRGRQTLRGDKEGWHEIIWDGERFWESSGEHSEGEQLRAERSPAEVLGILRDYYRRYPDPPLTDEELLGRVRGY